MRRAMFELGLILTHTTQRLLRGVSGIPLGENWTALHCDDQKIMISLYDLFLIYDQQRYAYYQHVYIG